MLDKHFYLLSILSSLNNELKVRKSISCNLEVIWNRCSFSILKVHANAECLEGIRVTAQDNSTKKTRTKVCSAEI